MAERRRVITDISEMTCDNCIYSETVNDEALSCRNLRDVFFEEGDKGSCSEGNWRICVVPGRPSVVSYPVAYDYLYQEVE